MKKFISLILVLLLMTPVITGCNNKETQGSKEEKNAQKEEKQSDNMTKFNIGKYPILDEKETFKIYMVQLSPFISANEKAVVKKGIEDTNVVTDFVEVASSNWEEKVNILFSTDDLPDAFLDDLKIDEVYEQLTPLDEYLTEEIAPNIVKFLNERPEYWEILKAPDGKIYSLPTGDETYWNVVDSQMFINEDWLKAVGKEMPKNAVEFKDVLKAFKEQDANGNGDPNDEVPMTFRGVWNWGHGMENALSVFGVFESSYHVMTNEGKVTFAAKDERYFDALKYYHELYSEGLIDQECFTHSSDQYSAKLADTVDKYGVVITYNKSTPWVPFALADESGKITVGINNIQNTGGFSITKKCKNPGALVRWYDYCNKDVDTIMAWNRGIENESWRFAEEGKDHKYEFMDDKGVQEKYGVANRAELRNLQSFSGKSPSYVHLAYTSKFGTPEGQVRLKPIHNQMIIDNGYGVQALPAGFASKENSSKRAVLLADIDNYINKFVATSVVDGIDEEAWEKHLDTLEKLKVDEYTGLCQEFVDARKK